MNRRVLPLIIGLLLLPLACGGNDGLDVDDLAVLQDDLAVLQPNELCSDHPEGAIATFEDIDLEVAVRNALSVGAGEPLTCGLMSGLTVLGASGVTSLEGIQNLTSLSMLFLGPDFHGGGNAVTDLNPLSGLTSLTHLDLVDNPITDIQALLDNTGLGAGDRVQLGRTNVSCADLALLEAKGVIVWFFNCP